MKRIFIAIMAVLACSAVTFTASAQAKKIIKQMKKAEGVTIAYGLIERPDSPMRSKIEVVGDKQRNVSR